MANGKAQTPTFPFVEALHFDLFFFQVYSLIVILPKTPLRERLSLPCKFGAELLFIMRDFKCVFSVTLCHT